MRLLGAVCGLLPLAWAQRLGAVLGWTWYHLVPIRRRVVASNLALAFPELPPPRRRRIAARCFRHVATTVLEMLWLGGPRLGSLGELVDVEGLEHYRRVQAEGRGTIAVTAHLGSFDLLACSQALAGVPLHVVTKDLGAKGLSALWMERRRAAGVRLLPARGSMKEVLRALRAGEVLGLVVDQRTPLSEGGTELPFFGRPALTTRAPAVLAARTGAALLPVVARRRPDGTHRVCVGPEIPLGATAEETMTAINRQVERWVRWSPEQWLWLHRRWAT